MTKRKELHVVCSSPSRAVERMNGPNPGKVPPARIIALSQAAATSRSLRRRGLRRSPRPRRRPKPRAASRMKCCSAGLLIRRRPSTSPLRSIHSACANESVSRSAMPCGIALDQASKPMRPRERPRSRSMRVARIGGGLAIGMALEAGIQHLTGDRHAFHRSRDEHHLARRRNDQNMRREVAPVIEAGQIENVLRRRDETGSEIQRPPCGVRTAPSRASNSISAK